MSESTSTPKPVPSHPDDPLLVLNLGHGAQVVEYSLARRILWLAGASAVRVQDKYGDKLVVYRHDFPGERGSLYLKPEERSDKNIVLRLDVDEGSFSDCLALINDPSGPKGRPYTFEQETVTLFNNMPDMEMVDYCDLVGVLRRLAVPDFQVRSSPFMGRGYTQSHYLNEDLAGLATLPRNDTGLVIVYRLGLLMPEKIERTPSREEAAAAQAAVVVPPINPLA